jgi:hypothetical protein
VGFKEGAERRRSCLLLALDEQGDADPEAVAQDLRQCAQGTHVGHDARLVIRRSPAVQAAVAFDGGERVALPQVRISRRLHVVVCVEQHRRLARGGRASGDDGGPAGDAVVVDAQDLHILHP